MDDDRAIVRREVFGGPNDGSVVMVAADARAFTIYARQADGKFAEQAAGYYVLGDDGHFHWKAARP